VSLQFSKLSINPVLMDFQKQDFSFIEKISLLLKMYINAQPGQTWLENHLPAQLIGKAENTFQPEEIERCSEKILLPFLKGRDFIENNLSQELALRILQQEDNDKNSTLSKKCLNLLSNSESGTSGPGKKTKKCKGIPIFETRSV
jgi:hypothetical protein